MKKLYVAALFFAFVIVTFVSGCAGPVRYAKTAENAEDFSPRSVALFPVSVGPHDEAAGIIDRITVDELTKTDRYDRVLSPDEVMRIIEENEAAPIFEEYQAKLEILNYSDPALSARLGEVLDVESFLLVIVSFWSYTVDTKEKDIAKVGLEMRFVEASTGRILWAAHHFDEKRYRVFKPELADVGEAVARRLVREMPH
ncbi:MAG TPA: hypothetical protein ENN35_09265 [Deltaproteobacteria bacterium]|nr:hypothetical protein [Deltaproteobacteria bacterium]